MSKVLRLYNSFTKVVDDVRLGGRLIDTQRDVREIINGSLYICGPTVYSDCHLGHALTYIRADLFRRFIKSIFNIKLTTVMNITDVDDKILSKVNELQEYKQTLTTADPSKHPFNHISDKYYRSFQDDMRLIRVEPPDLTFKVSNHISLITHYISKLEKQGHAYIAQNGDIYFDTMSMNNYIGRTRQDEGARVDLDEFKRDPRDFALWKAAKPGEPIWSYHSEITNRHLPGRPGWHVQCSAIASAIFGNQLDFHFGGIDLLFPHHYNEEACCCAFHKLDTSKSTHVWSKHWLHSGHLVLKDLKMSKSLGNVIAIKSFVNDSSVNALRLLCISTHYRSNVDFGQVLMDHLKSIDHRLSAFITQLNDSLARIRNEDSINQSSGNNNDIQEHLSRTNEDILNGVCDEFDLERGLNSILDLTKIIYNYGFDNIHPRDIVAIWQLLSEWCAICGLEYGPMRDYHDDSVVQLIRNFRQNIRTSTLVELKRAKNEQNKGGIQFLNSLLRECDNVRTQLDELGFVERDNRTKHLPYIKT